MPNNEAYLQMYRRMLAIRLFEERVNDLYTRALMPGLAHLYIGEEAVAVGVCEALRKDDYITSTHRGHGHCLAKGASPDLMFAELLGKKAGYCKGKGGSMHIADHANGNLGANAIVGGSAALATGAAYSSKYLNQGRVVVCFFGEGALGQGVLYESMNLAQLWKLPVVYVCENNLYNEYTHFTETTAGEIVARPAAFGIQSATVDGQNVRAVYDVGSKLVDRARKGEGPAFVLANTYRFRGHHVGDISRDYYRTKQEEQRWMEERDPIKILGAYLTGDHIVEQAELDRVQDEEMRRDERVVLLGEDVAEAGTAFKVLTGLVQEFGPKRVVDTPISEAGFTGIGVGAAMTGMRPIVDIMFGDFLALVMDQLANQAAKIHYMSGGKWRVPLVVRATLGASRRSAAQHSQSLHAWPSHIPGLKVVVPSTPYDAKGLMKSAIRDDNPVVFFEDKMQYKVKGDVPSEEYTIPLGVAEVKREGRDITIVATSSMVQVAVGAARMLEAIGIDAEVVDPRTTWPLDEKTIVDSVKKTSRAIVVDEGYGRYGVASEIASVIAEGAFYNLDAPVTRVAAMHVPIPFSPPLEDATIPTEKAVFDTAKRLCGK
ncbi:MAG: hypothetical protein DMG04_04310 [Acidobacteria bacterium]|nr:MAG: hypothetical protein DMG04_04310 [Acidobacteriota bacterium]